MATDRQDINLNALRKILLDRTAELERLSKMLAQSREAVELDQIRQGRLSRQDALMQQEMPKETDDDYGYCAKRLELDPAIVICIDCAA